MANASKEKNWYGIALAKVTSAKGFAREHAVVESMSVGGLERESYQMG